MITNFRSFHKNQESFHKFFQNISELKKYIAIFDKKLEIFQKVENLISSIFYNYFRLDIFYWTDTCSQCLTLFTCELRV